MGSSTESAGKLLFSPLLDGFLILVTAPEKTGAADRILEEPREGA
jgi:hypothetical protein